MNRCLFFVPVYDQVSELPIVLGEIDTAELSGVDFLLVNNGSRDGSQDLIWASRHEHLDVNLNRGIGYSYLLGLEWARDRGYEFFGTMAANGKMLASEIPQLMSPLRNGEADYVTGSRFLDGGSSPNLPSFRRRTIPIINLIARITTGASLTDATNGFRAFRLNLLDHARFDWHAEWLWTYGLEYYLYAKVLRDPRLRAVEVPATMRYPESGQYSKISPGIDWWYMIRPWISARMTPGFNDNDVEAGRRTP